MSGGYLVLAKKQIQAPPEAKNANLKATASAPRGGTLAAEKAKTEFLRLYRDGHTIKQALAYVGRSYEAYKKWRTLDEDFKVKVRHIQQNRKGGSGQEVPDFPEFCETYLGMKLFWHQLQWYDFLEGRTPRDLHPAQNYEPGADPHMLLLNVPPGHAKSTVVTAAYTLWRIVKDPDAKVVIVSANEKMAKDWLWRIKEWLTSDRTMKLQADFGPEGGWKETAGEWSSTRIRLSEKIRKSSEANPTVQVLGMGGVIYGARADLIILDDVVQGDNAHQYEEQIDWLTGMVLTRPSDEDKVLVVGTRVAPIDLYRELRNQDRYEEEGGSSPWTYFSSPAVLEFADDPKDWVTLWPKSNIPKAGTSAKPDSDGLYTKWDGESLARMRKRISTQPRAWSLNYQQEEVADEAHFPRDLVYSCVDNRRNIGLLDRGMFKRGYGTPRSGMDGLKVVAGLDPASAGHTAAVVVAFDPDTGKRWLLDAWDKAGATPRDTRELMIDWVQRYKVQEWRVEKVMLQQWIMQDEEITRELSKRGCILAHHITTKATKWDPDGGILSLTALISGADRGQQLLQLPTTRKETVRALCDQMVTWYPKTKGKTDLMMALWFCETRIRQFAMVGDGGHYAQNPFSRGMDETYQVVVDIHDPELEGQPVPSPSVWRRRALR